MLFLVLLICIKNSRQPSEMAAQVSATIGSPLSQVSWTLDNSTQVVLLVTAVQVRFAQDITGGSIRFIRRSGRNGGNDAGLEINCIGKIFNGQRNVGSTYARKLLITIFPNRHIAKNLGCFVRL